MKTAVEWLFLMMNNPNKDQEFANKLLDKAKEIEKEQIIDSYRDGRSDQQSDRQSRFYNRMAEQYYNETFKSE
jgi:ABC-type nitrate/sulfonate/bicarbonate transport system substrate-binding protein